MDLGDFASLMKVLSPSKACFDVCVRTYDFASLMKVLSPSKACFDVCVRTYDFASLVEVEPVKDIFC